MKWWLCIAGVCCLGALTRLGVAIAFPSPIPPLVVTDVGEARTSAHGSVERPSRLAPTAAEGRLCNAEAQQASDPGTDASTAWHAHLTSERSEVHWRAIFDVYSAAERVPEFHNRYDAAPVRPLGQEPTRVGGVQARGSDLLMFEPIRSLRARISARNGPTEQAFADGMFGLLGWRLGDELEVSVGLQTGGHELGARDLARFLVARQRGSWRELSEAQRGRVAEAILRLFQAYEQGRRAMWSRVWAMKQNGTPVEGRVAGLRWDAGRLWLMHEGASATADDLASRLESQVVRLRERMEELFR